MLEVSNLTKRYGRTLAVDGLNLVTRPGEVLALLVNGAGKITIRCATGLARPASGRKDRGARRGHGAASG